MGVAAEVPLEDKVPLGGRALSVASRHAVSAVALLLQMAPAAARLGGRKT